MRPLARVAYQSAVELTPPASDGHPLTREDLPVEADEAHRLVEARRARRVACSPHTMAAVVTRLASTQLAPVAETRTQ